MRYVPPSSSTSSSSSSSSPSKTRKSRSYSAPYTWRQGFEWTIILLSGIDLHHYHHPLIPILIPEPDQILPTWERWKNKENLHLCHHPHLSLDLLCPRDLSCQTRDRSFQTRDGSCQSLTMSNNANGGLNKLWVSSLPPSPSLSQNLTDLVKLGSSASWSSLS